VKIDNRPNYTPRIVIQVGVCAKQKPPLCTYPLDPPTGILPTEWQTAPPATHPPHNLPLPPLLLQSPVLRISGLPEAAPSMPPRRRFPRGGSHGGGARAPAARPPRLSTRQQPPAASLVSQRLQEYLGNGGNERNEALKVAFGAAPAELLEDEAITLIKSIPSRSSMHAGTVAAVDTSSARAEQLATPPASLNCCTPHWMRAVSWRL